MVSRARVSSRALFSSTSDVQVHRLNVEAAFAGIGQQLARQIGGAFAGDERLADMAGRILAHLQPAQGQGALGNHPRQEVVEVMSHAPCQQAHALQLLMLPQRALHVLPLERRADEIGKDARGLHFERGPLAGAYAVAEIDHPPPAIGNINRDAEKSAHVQRNEQPLLVSRHGRQGDVDHLLLQVRLLPDVHACLAKTKLGHGGDFMQPGIHR